MRITLSTPHRLILEDRPWVLGIILTLAILFPLLLALATWRDAPWLAFAMGLVAAMFGAAFVAFVRRVIVILDRDAGTVVILFASLLGQTETTLALADITQAELETVVNRSTKSTNTSSSTSETHRTVLHVGAEIVPLAPIYTGGNGAERAATAINDWLALPGA
ncbi:hypothetical protein MCELHM10_02452 [Paracoccaceae bacterium]|jgi:hypothetical protein